MVTWTLTTETGKLYYTASDTAYTYLKWVSSTGSTSWAVSTDISTVDYIVLSGGGGGGGGVGGGGGGAGGLLTGTGLAVSGTETITVGAGGAGGAVNTAGSKGSASVFSTITATGGGWGAGYYTNGSTAWARFVGGAGGSGGGAGADNSTTIRLGGTGTVGQGKDGGRLLSDGLDYHAGGGGGAGSSGGTNGSTYSGVGGSGSTHFVSATTTDCLGGGGGGGGVNPGVSGGAGGVGGGGAGAMSGAGTAGTANYGAGGGGGGGAGAGGAGGSGVVIIRYAVAGGVAPTASFSLSRRTLQAGSVNTFTDASTGTAPIVYTWTFGDGVTSTAQNPTRKYQRPGQYNVTLQTSNATGSDSTYKPILVN